MKTLLVAFTASALVAVAGVGVVEACGAKFLVATRAARQQKTQRAANPTRILLYQHSDDPGDTPEIVAEATAQLRGMLEGAGHTVSVARDETALRDMARDAQVRVVMLGIDTARRLKSDVASWSSTITVLPVADHPTRSERAEIREEFGEVFILGDTKSGMLQSVERSYQRN